MPATKTGATAAPAAIPGDDLRNIPNRSVEQILAESAQLEGKVVSLNFRLRGAKLDQAADQFTGEIIEIVETAGKKGTKKKKISIATQGPKEAFDWFKRVPAYSADEDGQSTAVFARVTKGAKGKLTLDLLATEKRTDMSGSRIIWTGL